jgi:phosphoribosylformylglycinamidine synthase
MPRVKVLVLTGFGLNCDVETAHAFELAGASAERVHINSVIDGSVRLDGFRIIVFIGGFSWGDDHGAGVIQAVRLRTTLGAELSRFVDQGNLVLGICNGFQTLANLGLLPGFEGEASSRSVALIANRCGNFRNQWVRLQVNPESRCVFTRDIRQAELPVRHGEGQFYAEPETLQRLDKGGQIVLRYALPDGSPAAGSFPHNPNGSVDDVAGICDASGRVFGLMPHPEAFNDWTNHPDWPRHRESAKRSGQPFGQGLPVGIKILKNGVDYLRGSNPVI